MKFINACGGVVHEVLIRIVVEGDYVHPIHELRIVSTQVNLQSRGVQHVASFEGADGFRRHYILLGVAGTGRNVHVLEIRRAGLLRRIYVHVITAIDLVGDPCFDAVIEKIIDDAFPE